MPLFPLSRRTAEYGSAFRKNDVVKATVDLPGVPQGTEGRVKMINGFDWQRYWVFFDNGVELGQLDTDELVRPAHWDTWHEAQAERAAEEARAAEAAANPAAAESTEGAAADGDPNDPLARLRAMVPAHLLERSKAARERLSA